MCVDLEDLATAKGESDEHMDDPLSSLDLDAYIVQHLRSIHGNDPAGFEALCTSLNPSQIQTVRAMFC